MKFMDNIETSQTSIANQNVYGGRASLLINYVNKHNAYA